MPRVLPRPFLLLPLLLVGPRLLLGTSSHQGAGGVALALAIAALAVPALAARDDRRPVGPETLGVLLLAVAAGIGVFDGVLALAPAGALLLCGGAFAFLLAGATRLGRACTGRPILAQASATGLAIVLFGAVFVARPILDGLPRAWRPAAVQGLVAVNPLAAPIGGILGVDWLRGPRTYLANEIGPYHPYAYPGWLPVVLVQVGAGGMLTGIGLIVGRRRGKEASS